MNLRELLKHCCWCQTAFFVVLCWVFVFYLILTTNRFVNVILNTNISINSKDLQEWIQPSLRPL